MEIRRFRWENLDIIPGDGDGAVQGVALGPGDNCLLLFPGQNHVGDILGTRDGEVFPSGDHFEIRHCDQTELGETFLPASQSQSWFAYCFKWPQRNVGPTEKRI